MSVRGIVLCLLSAVAFGAMGVFGQLAYDEEVTVGTLLAARFLAASAVLWLLLLATGAHRRLRALTRREVALAIGLGAVGYAAQAGAYFGALTRLDPGVLSLLLYTFPAIVAVAAVALGREAFSGRVLTALGLASAGLVLVVAGAGAGELDAIGVALALTAACVYAAYILTSEGIAGRTGPLVLSALVCSGAAVTLVLASAALGDLRPAEVTGAGWGWLGAIALVSTVGAILLFFAGLPLVGPTAAAILSTVEPVTAVVLAYVAFGDVLGVLQALGGGLVLAAVPVLTGRSRKARAEPGLSCGGCPRSSHPSCSRGSRT